MDWGQALGSADEYDFLDDLLVATFYPMPAPVEVKPDVIDMEAFLDDVFGAGPALVGSAVEEERTTSRTTVPGGSLDGGIRADGRSSMEEIVGSGPLDEKGAKRILRRLRDEIVRPNALEAGWEWDLDQSIFREAMIEAFVGSRISDEEDWFKRIPVSFRQRTDPAEKRRYLSTVVDVISRIKP